MRDGSVEKINKKTGNDEMTGMLHASVALTSLVVWPTYCSKRAGICVIYIAYIGLNFAFSK